MMSVKTVVRNESQLRDCYLVEVNADVSRRPMAKLEKKSGHYEILCIPNATYLEYWVASDLATLEPEIISTEDCMEYSEIAIVDDGKMGLKLIRSPRNSEAPQPLSLRKPCIIM